MRQNYVPYIECYVMDFCFYGHIDDSPLVSEV